MLQGVLSRALLIVAGVFLFSTNAQAYPQYIAKGYANCASCHYAPDGGAMANAYGSATQQAFLPEGIDVEWVQDLREVLQKNGVTGYDDDEQAEFQWDLGFDSRLLFMLGSGSVGSTSDFILIPMLLEAQSVMAYGDLTFYGSVSSRRAGADFSDRTAFSRHHWLQYRVSDELSVRAGRMTLPFGIRQADHTAFTRGDLGLDKYDQSYGVQVDYNAERWAISAMGFAGNFLLGDPKVQERGLAATAAYLWVGRAAVGISLLGAVSELDQRLAAGVFARAKLIDHSYVLAEFDSQWRQSKDGSRTQHDLLGFTRFGWFPWEWLDLYAEAGLKMTPGSSELTKVSASLGAAWQILPWMEVGPYVRILHGPDGGTQFQVIDQLHIVY